ncbi:MAG: hypothetical protein GXO09_01410 [Crenarchaeota archaeon]|nr:hypothetical protein [Thermoproteota archaeon]
MARRLPSIYLEGLAATGHVVDARLEECEVPGRVKIVCRLRDGGLVESQCIDERGARRLLFSIKEYIRLSRVIVRGQGA